MHVKCLAGELVKAGHEVHILHSLDAYGIKRRTRIENELPSEIHTHPIKTHLNASSYFAYTVGNSPTILRKFARLAKEIRPDVVHHHNISLLGYGILRKYGEYLNLYTAHDYWLICQQSNLLKNGSIICGDRSCFLCALRCNRPPQIWRHSAGFRAAINNVDLIIAPSDYIRKRLIQRIGVKSITLPNFAPPPPVNVPPVDYSNYFLFVGLLEKHKGILNLLDLFKDARNDLKTKLIIAGDGSLRSCIQDFIKRSSLNDLVSFLGFVDNKKLYSLYANALAVIIPSIWPENAPLVALEALSVGTPAIVSNNGGLPEIMKKVSTSLIFDDLNHLKNILLNFSRKDLSPSKIRHIYQQNFSLKAYANNYIVTVKHMLR